jgi:isocitrate/isopropylmalate dehydrogenase
MFLGSGEFMPDPNMALSIRKITAKGSARVARAAFELARGRRKKVTAVHKANVVKLSDGLFLREVRKVAAEYPDVELEELIVDATAALLIRTPDRFDVIVTANMFGDILSDEASELSGSLGLGGSINAGDTICVAQAQHGSAPDLAGKNLANPTSLILSAAMLLDWRGRRDGNAKLVEAGALIERSVERVLDDPATRTPDIGGTLGTDAFSAAVIAAMHATHTRSIAA